MIELCETKMAFSNERELGDEIRQTKSNIDQSKLAVQKMAKIEELERAEEEQKKRLKMYQDEKKVLERDYETAKREATKFAGQYFFDLFFYKSCRTRIDL